MIKLQWNEPQSVADVQTLVQGAINLEFATLPPYLYAKFSILPGANPAASRLIDSVVTQEMIHMCLACNIMNAIQGNASIVPPHYPKPLPGDVDASLTVHLLPFSVAAMEQGMAIESPTEPVRPTLLAAEADQSITIGEYYVRLDKALAALPANAWKANNKQIDDAQFFQGQIFAVNNYQDASRAIDNIVSEGEGTPVTPDNSGSPLDFQHDLAHYYRFWEIVRDQVITKDDSSPVGYAWGAPLGVDWSAVYPAIADPEQRDFSGDPPAARAAQLACNVAYTAMVDALNGAFSGRTGGLGVAVRAMFDLRMATLQALTTPLADGHSVAGPAFVYLDTQAAARTPVQASAQGDAA